MNRIITAPKFHRYERPADIIPLIDPEHSGASMLIEMCRRPHRAFTKQELVEIGGFAQHRHLGNVNAAFYFWILRINDSLPRTGWRINDSHNYRLQQISIDQETALIRRLGIAA